MSQTQSQLEAALLGQSSAIALRGESEAGSPIEDREEAEDFLDEDIDFGAPFTRTVTLQMLLSAGVLKPGAGTMSIEYLGQRFVGDLLEDGRIRSQETDAVFASPSAWAVACKRFINPVRRSGCGWASIRYRGRKLDAYKNVWYWKRKEAREREKEGSAVEQYLLACADVSAANAMHKTMAGSIPYHRMVVKHNTIANRTLTHDANTLIECVPFSNLGKIQPFLVSLSTNAALLMDFHCHLTKSEVCGYLAGHWDLNSHNLQITHAFPCRNTKGDRDSAQSVEGEIARAIEKEKLILVGWYHSHVHAAAAPTLRDVDAQLDYQIRMKGTSDNGYTPCVGIIISPYNYESASLESSIVAYWVVPPPEAKPNEYGRPMLMSYSVVQDSLLTACAKDELKRCAEYYRREPDFIGFGDRYLGNTLYVDKLKSTLISKFPRDESETLLWRLIRDALGHHVDENDGLLSIPKPSTVTSSSASSASQSGQQQSQILPPSSSLHHQQQQHGLHPNLASNMMLPTDISSLLFNSGKFPSASSLLGLPDPMAHSTLAANNMFLSTNLFKMQELLKPLGSSSPIPSSAQSSAAAKSSAKGSPAAAAAGSMKELCSPVGGVERHAPSPLKIPSDFSTPDFLALKTKLDFIAPDLGLSSSQTTPVSTSTVTKTMTSSSSASPSPKHLGGGGGIGGDFSIPLAASSSSLSSSSKQYQQHQQLLPDYPHIPDLSGLASLGSLGGKCGSRSSTPQGFSMSDYGMSLSKLMDLSGERSSKVAPPKTDFSSMLDLSFPRNSSVSISSVSGSEGATDLSVGAAGALDQQHSGADDDKPLNLAA